MSASEVEAARGKPDRIVEQQWVYDGGSFMVLFEKGGTVSTVMISPPKDGPAFPGRTEGGLGLGSTREEVMKSCETPRVTTTADPTREMVTCSDHSIQFQLVSGRVQWVSVKAPKKANP